MVLRPSFPFQRPPRGAGVREPIHASCPLQPWVRPLAIFFLSMDSQSVFDPDISTRIQSPFPLPGLWPRPAKGMPIQTLPTGSAGQLSGFDLPGAHPQLVVHTTLLE